MKKFYLLALILLLPILSACTLEKETQLFNEEILEVLNIDEEGNTSFDKENLNLALNNITTEELSDVEIEGILFMLEEEKLAHDVYAYLYDKWGLNIFTNISSSEATHVAAVNNLVDRYNISIPESLDSLGVFENDDLQKLYDTLIAQGSGSLVAALKVGAAIEEIDILDLEKYIAQTDKEDIKLVYDNLMKGSRNHLRSFVKNLDSNGVDYDGDYLEADDYDDIVNSDIERGQGRGRRK